MQAELANLSQLRDLHVPPNPSVWPLALGWWMIMGVILATIVILFYYRSKKNKPKKIALGLIEQLQKKHEENNIETILPQLSILIRKIAISRFDRQSVANLHGENWLAFLDRTGKTRDFSQGAGKILATAPYKASPHMIDLQLFDTIKQWVKTIYD